MRSSMKMRSSVRACELHEAVDVLPQNLRHAHEPRAAAVEHDGARGDRLLAVRERVERDYRLLLALARLELELDPHRVAREVVELADGNLLLLDRVLYRLGERVGRLAPRKLGDDELVLAVLLDLRADLDLAEAVLVLAHVHEAAELEVGVELERLLLDERDLGFEKLDEVVREYRRRKADRDAVCAHHQQKRDLRGKVDWLLLAAVVVGDVGGGLAVEDFLLRKLGEAALDVPDRGVRHPRQERAEVALAVDEISLALSPQLVGEDYDCVADRRVAVRMVLHRLADDVGDLGVPAVVLLV